jgi:hypothetical protein
MPATTHHLDQFDVDIAQLGDPLDDDALDALSSVIDARDALAEMTNLINRLQSRLEAGQPAYATREEYAFDLDQLADRVHIAVAGILG